MASTETDVETAWQAGLPGMAPMDDDGFVQSFDVTDSEGITAFYKTYGFVVVRDIATEEQVECTMEEIWEIAKRDSAAMCAHASWRDLLLTPILETVGLQTPAPRALARDWPASWADSRDGGFWPYPSAAGFIGMGVASGEEAWNNRTNERLYKAFATVLGAKELIVSCDRYGMMRPTFIPTENGQLEEIVKWRTRENWFHWDMNPWYWCGAEVPPPRCTDSRMSEELLDGLLRERWERARSAEALLITENNNKSSNEGFDKVQGLLTLTDSTEADGGFTCVPGFQNVLQQYCETHKMEDKVHFIHASDDMAALAQKVTARKGSAIIWSSCLPHCNFPNRSSNFRVCQYIKMFPLAVMDRRNGLEEARAGAIKRILPETWQPTELGNKLLGQAPWK